MYEEIGGFFEYSLYDRCWYENGDSPPNNTRRMLGALNDYHCGAGYANDMWIKNAHVKDALHVESDAQFFSGDNGVGFTYNSTESSVQPFYHEVVSNTSLRVLIYNGDSDSSILNSLTGYNWTLHMGFEML